MPAQRPKPRLIHRQTCGLWFILEDDIKCGNIDSVLFTRVYKCNTLITSEHERGFVMEKQEYDRLIGISKQNAEKVLTSKRSLREKIDHFNKVGFTYLDLYTKVSDKTEKKLYKSVADMYERIFFKLLREEAEME